MTKKTLLLHICIIKCTVDGGRQTVDDDNSTGNCNRMGFGDVRNWLGFFKWLNRIFAAILHQNGFYRIHFLKCPKRFTKGVIPTNKNKMLQLNKSMPRSIFLSFLFFISLNLFFTNCTYPAIEKSKTSVKQVAIKENQQEEKIPFPVYMTFSEFEHHIHYKNDTTYVVNFWATWCKPCVAELPYFEKLIPAYKNKPVQVLLVSMDFPKQIKSKLIPFVKKRQLEKSVVALADMDYNEWIDKVSTEWDGAIPFTIIYNSKKQQVKLGELEGYEELEGLLATVLE